MASVASDGVRRRGCCFGPPETDCILTFIGACWRLWGTHPRTVDTTHRDNAEIYTAACWGPGSQRLSLGCASGRVQVWDAHAGELVGPAAEGFRAVAKGEDYSVFAIATSSELRATVFVGCHATSEILEIGVGDGKTRRSFKAGKAGICHLAARSSLGAEWLISAGVGSALRLWQLVDASADEKPRVHAKLAAPSSSATCLDLHCFGDLIVVVCADGAAQIDAFGISNTLSDTSKKCTLGASLVLSSHEIIQGARIVPPSADTAVGAKSHLGVVGHSPSTLAFWSFALERVSQTTATPKTLASSFTILADRLGGHVLCARGTESAAPIVAAVGALAKPSFVRVTAAASKGEDASVELLDKNIAREQAALSVGEASRQQAVVLGPLETLGVQRKAKRKRLMQEAEDGARERVDMLPKASRTDVGGISIAPMLRQALRSRDDQRISIVFASSDTQIIDATVSQLSGSEAFDMLQECAKRLISQREFSTQLCTWMQCVLLRHCAFISARPVLQRALKPLHDIFEARCVTYRSVVLLRGRLHQARCSRKELTAREKLERETVHAPLLEYVEGDEDLDEEGSSEGGAEVAEESGEVDSDEDVNDESPDLEGD
mmetsp:Transcript_54207/g.126156  ORF Transcript_54207/g.126156 Transcript_54207/m.126156 type:complete len:607 (+) Transcript_54207:21-1841(+)